MSRVPVVLVLILGVAAALVLTSPEDASGGPADHPELKKSIERGRELFGQAFAPGQKSCAACHAGGANKITGKRLNAYPLYDKDLKAVVSVQQKLNQMIESKCKGSALPLGSPDLNALEAYMKTL